MPERCLLRRLSASISASISAPLSLLALPVLLTGCFSFAPNPIVQYRNLDPDPVFARGLQVNAYRADSLHFGVAVRDFSWDAVKYLQSYVRPLTFIVRVRNRGDAAVLIDPADFTLTANPCDSAQTLIDPELVLYTSQEEIEIQRADKMNSEANQAVVGLLDLAGEAISISDTTEEAERRRKARREYHREQDENQRRMEYEIGNLEALKARWIEEPIRKTTLGPGKMLEGTLAFSLNPPFPDTLVLRYRGPVGVTSIAVTARIGGAPSRTGYPEFELGHYRLQPPPEGSAAAAKAAKASAKTQVAKPAIAPTARPRL